MTLISEITNAAGWLILCCISILFMLLFFGSLVEYISRQMVREAFRRRVELRRRVARTRKVVCLLWWKWVPVHVWDYVLISSQIRLPKSKGPLFQATHKGPSPERDTTCPICLREMRTGQGLFIHTSCKNSWHQRCLETWLRGTKLRDSTCLACHGPGLDTWKIGPRTSGRFTWYPIAIDVVQARHSALSIAWVVVSVVCLLTFGRRMHPFTIISLYYCRRSVSAWVYVVDLVSSTRPRTRSAKQMLSLALEWLNISAAIYVIFFVWWQSGAFKSLMCALVCFLTLMEGYIMGKCIAQGVGALVQHW